MTPPAQSIQMSKNPDTSVLRDGTKVVVSGRDPQRFGGMVNPPVYHVSTVLAETVEQLKSKDHAEESGKQEMTYGRRGTPTSVSYTHLTLPTKA